MEVESSQIFLKDLQGFSKLNRKERFKLLKSMGVLTKEDVKYFESVGPDIELAENFIENVLGYFHMPLGVATNFIINNKPYIIPMAVEETSIVAAASKTAKWINQLGQITTRVIGKNIIGQIQISKVKDLFTLKEVLDRKKTELIAMVNEDVAAGLVRRGGGVNDILLRAIDRGDGHSMAVIHVHADPCDAMGANIMNQICEYLKSHIEVLTSESVTMCILSNLVDTKVVEAKIEIRGTDPKLGEKIQEASLFAQLDPYRAATNNKGVLNGIDPILMATGNDWRAVEAGIHAYAAKDGQYRSVTKWSCSGDVLTGVFIAPIIVGVVGGVTKLHPTAQLALRMMKITSADELSQVCAAVGLAQNLGALKALTTVGIIEGHMKLHIKNLTIGAGASEQETLVLQKRLEEILKLTKRISLGNAVDVLKEIRNQRMSKESSISNGSTL